MGIRWLLPHHQDTGYFTFLPLGARQIRGHTPAQVFQVTGQQAGRTRIDIAAEHGLTPFVGRRRELTLLEELLEKTQGGYGQIVGVFGEAGMGKSRLLLEFRRRLQQEDVTYLEGRCLSYGQSILYLPLVDILKKYFALQDNSDQAITQRVSAGVERLGLDARGAPPADLCGAAHPVSGHEPTASAGSGRGRPPLD